MKLTRTERSKRKVNAAFVVKLASEIADAAVREYRRRAK